MLQWNNLVLHKRIIMLFKKIRKLFRSPKEFFLGSQWFSSPFFDNKKTNGNVMIVTTLGQLNQAESIIKFNNIDSPTLVIMYTTQNMRMPRLMYSTANKKLFRSIYMYELPLKPGKVDLKKYYHMNKGYKKLLNELKPKNLYVMSFSGHYANLLNYAKNIGCKLHLVEEGTATYAPLSESFGVHRSKAQIFFQKGFVCERGYYDNFDELHVSFPDYGEKIFKADKYNYFLAHMSGINVTANHLKLQKKYNVSSDDYIYVSQIFPVDDDFYYSSVINYLEKFLLNITGKIFIKLHPKEMEKSRIMKMFLDKSKNNSRIIVINEPPFLIDPFIYLVEPKGVIGITSTALVYAPLLVPDIESISIAKLVISDLAGKNENVDMMSSHLQILQNYKFVNIVNSDNFVINAKYAPKLNFDELVARAESTYKAKHYYHAIFYWRLAFRNDISLLKQKSLWYFNALNKTNQVYKMKKNEVLYIDSIRNFNSKDIEIWQNIKKEYLSK